MNIPMVTHPTYELTLPSTNAVIKYRPYVVKEEKVLAMAMQSGNEQEIKQAMGDIVRACTFGEVDIDVNPMFDVQYVFLKLRCKSVGEISEMTVRCGSCDHEQPHLIQLDSIEVTNIRDDSGLIEFPGAKLQMKYPTVDTLIRIKESEDIDEVFLAIVSCIESIVTDEEVVKNTDENEADFVTFLESLTPEQYQKIQEFFTYMPSVTHTIQFACEKCNTNNAIVVDGLYNFFL